MASASDDFNRADSTNLGANWTEDSGDWEITSNTLRQQTSAGYMKVRYTGTAPATNDHESEVDGRSDDAYVGFGAFVRGAASSTVTYYAFLGFGGDAFYLVEITAGAENILDTGSACASATTYNARVRAEGTAITGYRNDVSDASATDASLTSGGWGAMTYDILDAANRWIDNWAGADVGAAAASLFPARQNRMPAAMLAMCLALCAIIKSEVLGWAEFTRSICHLQRSRSLPIWLR